MTPARIPKAPHALPVVGHVAALAVSPLGFLASLRPMGDLVQISIGRHPAYVVNSPLLIRQMLVERPGSFDKGMMFDKLRDFLGNGIGMSGGELHRTQRRLMQPAFHRHRISEYVEVMARSADEAVAAWPVNRPIAVEDEFSTVTLSVIARTLFRTELAAGAIAELQQAIPVALAGVMRHAIIPSKVLERIPTPGNIRCARAMKRTRQVVTDLIASYRASGADHGDVLSLLLTARENEDGRGMSDEQIHAEIMTILLAGIETSSCVLAWLFLELSRNPDIEARVLAEIEQVVGADQISAGHLPQLDILRRSVSETLRLHHPNWLVMRRTTEPVALGTAELPAGAEILFSPTTLHTDPGLFEDPLRFDPDRWLPDRAPERAEAKYIPFGAGTRQCIGDTYALAEVAVIAATVLKRWQLTGSPAKRRPVVALTVHPRGLRLTPVRRPQRPVRVEEVHR
ncbi:cytochrome P450 [Kribbella sp. NPDC056861]|uniref:cytochrome P450 n=1 Tax=Kribbella sp. NPDC056861 TaxID=3154857 RepID=UPI003432EE3D